MPLNPTYRWSINTQTVTPVYDRSLALNYEQESSQTFFRKKLNGKLIFSRDDYDWIVAQSFDTEFVVLLERYVAGTWATYFTGRFYKTDCEIDVDNKKIEVALATVDGYEKVIEGLDKEFNLIELKPDIFRLKMDRRPAIQFYCAGDNTVGSILGNNYWEQEADEIIVDTSEMQMTYKFNIDYNYIEFTVSGDFFDNAAAGYYVGHGTLQYIGSGYNTNGWYLYVPLPVGGIYTAYIKDPDTGAIIYQGPKGAGNTFTLSGTQGGVTKIVTATITTWKAIGARWITNSDTIDGETTYDIPTPDIVSDNKNYTKIFPYYYFNSYGVEGHKYGVRIHHILSSAPTEWGRNEDGLYFTKPTDGEFIPIARNNWANASVWFDVSTFERDIEITGRKEYILKDAYSLSSVINVLLAQLDATITHSATTEYSEFLYDTENPVSNKIFTLLLTQKSNIVRGDYDQPARKAPITLKQVFEMLKNVFRCFWYIEDGKLKIEHISWFRNGRSYTPTPYVGYDLVVGVDLKTKRAWEFAKNKYTFDKEQMPERTEYKWMDNVSTMFVGYPIEALSPYAEKGKVDTVGISSFTTDVDYMLISPGDISNDGFALFASEWDSVNERYKIIYEERTALGATYDIQNGYLSFLSLHEDYFKDDLPVKSCKVNNVTITAKGIVKSMKQEVSFPANYDPNVFHLIKTTLGYGSIDKLSINLSSRMTKATIAFEPDTIVTAPTITQFSINAGAATTTSRNVTLSLVTAGGAEEYLASESNTFVGSVWTIIGGTISFVLSETNEEKTVYIRVRRTGEFNYSAISYDAITLAEPAPAVVIASCTSDTDGIHYTLDLTGTTDATTFKVIAVAAGASAPSEGDWTAATSQTYAVSSEQSVVAPGTYDIYVRGYNTIGNDTAVLEDYVQTEVATTSINNPIVAPVLGGTTTVTFSRNVTLSIIFDAWITLDPASEVTTETAGTVLTIQVAQNTTGNDRVGTIELDSAVDTPTVFVPQYGT